MELTVQNAGHNSQNHQNMVSYTLNNINKIIANLEKSNRRKDDEGDATIIQEHVSTLMTKFSDDSYDLSRDLSSIVDTFKGDRFDSQQLEHIVEHEQQRSRHILQLASFLDNQVNKLFIVIEGMFGHLDKGRKLPLGMKESVSSKLSVVQETIDSMTKVMCSEPHELQNVMDKAEKDIATATEEAKTLDVVLPPHDQEPSPELPAPIIINLGPVEPSLDNIDASSVDEAEEEEENTGPSMWERLSAIRRNSGSKSNIPAIEEKPIMMDAECQTEVPETDDVVFESSTEEAAEVEMELDEPWGTYDSSRNDSPRTSSRPGNNNGGSRNGMRSPSSRNGRTSSADGRNNNEGGDLSGTTDVNEQNEDTASAGIGSGNTDPRTSARSSNDLSRPTSEQKKQQQQLLDQKQNSSINNSDNSTKQKFYGNLNDDEIKLITAFREGMKQILMQQKNSTSSQKQQQMNVDVDDFVSKALATETAALKSKANTKNGSGKQTKPTKAEKQPVVTSADSNDTSKTKTAVGTTKKTIKKSSTSGSKSATTAKVAKKKDSKTVDANSSSAKVAATDVDRAEENEEQEEDEEEGDEVNGTDSIKNEGSKRRLSLVQVVTEVITTTACQQQVEREKEVVGAAKGLGVLHPVDASESECEEEDMLEAMTGNSQLGNYQLDLQDVEEEIVAGGGGGGARYYRNRRNSNSVLLVSHKSGKIDLDLIVGEDDGVDNTVANQNDVVDGAAAANTDLDESVVSSVDLDSFQSDDQISVESEEPPDSDSDDVLLMSADSYLSGKQNNSSKKIEEDKKISEDPFYSPLTDGMMNVKSYPIVHHPSPETLIRMSQTKSHSHLKTALDGSRSRHGSVVRKTSSAGSHNRHHYSMQVEMATKGTSTEDLLVYDTGSSLFRPMVENRMKIGGGGERSVVTNAPSHLAPIEDKLVSRSLDSRLLLQPRRRNSIGSSINNLQSSSSSSAQNSFKSSKLLKRGSNIIKSSPNDDEDETNNDKDDSFDTNNNNNNNNNNSSKSPSSKKNKNSNKTSQQLFDEQLKASVNPLLEIYNKYHASLPESWKAQLLTASTTAADSSDNMMTIPSLAPSVNTLSEKLQKMNNDSACATRGSTDDAETAATAAVIAMNEIKLLNIKKQFASSIHVLENLKLTATNNLIRLGKCELLTSELLNLMNDGAADANVYQEKLETLFRKLGVLDASKMFVEIQLAHYRGMFMEIQAISESAFPTMMRDVEELRTSYKLFISTQGKIVRLGRRVKALKTYCATVQLLSPHINAAMKLDSRNTASATATGGVNRTEMDYYVFDEIQRLEAELETSRHRNNQLSEELYHVTYRADNSPGALSFYATLTDPSLIPSLKALTEDLLVLKDFANMSDHIDFATLRISLKKCVTATPYVERFIQKYNSLYKRWTKRRLEMYYIRNREGIVSDSSEGIEDGSDSCPICCNDRRSSGPNDVEFQKEMKKNMLLQKIMNVTRSSTASSPIKGSPTSLSPAHINNNSSMAIADNSSSVHLLSQTSISPQQLSLSQSLPALTVLPPLSHRQHPQRL